jgi:hypothetical protein
MISRNRKGAPVSLETPLSRAAMRQLWREAVEDTWMTDRCCDRCVATDADAYDGPMPPSPEDRAAWLALERCRARLEAVEEE